MKVGRAVGFYGVAFTAMLLLLPPSVYLLLLWRRFEVVGFAFYVPVEELRAGLSSLNFLQWLRSPILSINFACYIPIVATFLVTLGEALSALTIGFLLGTNLALLQTMRGRCALDRSTVVSSTVSASISSVIAGGITGVSGCCGIGAAGALLTLAGVGSLTAASIENAGPSISLLMILILSFQFYRLLSLNRRAKGDLSKSLLRTNTP